MKRMFVALGALLFAGALIQSPSVQAKPEHSQNEHAVFAGGCFWGMEAVFERLRGVKHVTAGFSGGSAMTAHYEVVSTGATGHAESVAIEFDPKQISYKQLLEIYFRIAHDPTQLNYQGPDHGSQYRSAIFYENDAQRVQSQSMIETLNGKHVFSQPIVTQLTPFKHFYAAESYHQHYYDTHLSEPYIVEEDIPKVRDLAVKYPQLFVEQNLR